MSSYQVLARKWRPHDFETIVGQEHVVTLRQGETVLIPATSTGIEFRPDASMTCLTSCIE